MKVSPSRFGAAMLGCAAAIVFSAGVASAAPWDPHLPDYTKNFCPGGHGVACDGQKYPDGSYWHQWGSNEYGWHYDCVSGNEPFPALLPPGGCDGAIPPAPAPPPAGAPA